MTPFCFLMNASARPRLPEPFVGHRRAGIVAHVFRDYFPSGVRDEQWLPEVGRRNWVVLSKDKWIRRREVERTALMNAGVAAFVLSSGDMKGTEMGRAFAKAYPRIRKLLRDYVPPFIATVNTDGGVRLDTAAQRRAGIRRDPADSSDLRDPSGS